MIICKCLYVALIYKLAVILKNRTENEEINPIYNNNFKYKLFFC